MDKIAIADEAEWVSRLTGEIYDAALDPTRWEGVLEASCAFLQGMAASLGSFDFLRADLNLMKMWGYDAPSLALFFEKYARNHPLVPASMLTRIGDVGAIEDGMPYDEFMETALYREFYKPRGIVDTAQATLDKSATGMAIFYVVRHESVGRVDDTMRRRMTLLFPHLRRAVLIGKLVDLHKIEAASLAATLDGLAAGMFLVDASGAIVHANTSGQAMLAKGDAVRAIGNRLMINQGGREQALAEICPAAESGDAAVGAMGVAVPFEAPDKKCYVASVLPLTSGARRLAGTQYSAVAAVFVAEAAREGSLPYEAIAQLYQLTPAELRVLFGVVEIGGVLEIASALGISQTTAKTHLQHVFAKTGVNRQADLIKLVAGYMSPLAGGNGGGPR